MVFFCDFSSCFEHRKSLFLKQSKERNCISRLVFRNAISRAPLGQFLILLEASVEMIQRWVSHLFTIRLILCLRCGPLRGRDLKKIINCPVYSQQAIVFSTENYSLALTKLMDLLITLQLEMQQRNLLQNAIVCLFFLLKLNDSFFRSGVLICIKIRSISSLSNLQHHENLTCFYSIICCHRKLTDWHVLILQHFITNQFTWRMFSF